MQGVRSAALLALDGLGTTQPQLHAPDRDVVSDVGADGEPGRPGRRQVQLGAGGDRADVGIRRAAGGVYQRKAGHRLRRRRARDPHRVGPGRDAVRGGDDDRHHGLGAARQQHLMAGRAVGVLRRDGEHHAGGNCRRYRGLRDFVGHARVVVHGPGGKRTDIHSGQSQPGQCGVHAQHLACGQRRHVVAEHVGVDPGLRGRDADVPVAGSKQLIERLVRRAGGRRAVQGGAVGMLQVEVGVMFLPAQRQGDPSRLRELEHVVVRLVADAVHRIGVGRGAVSRRQGAQIVRGAAHVVVIRNLVVHHRHRTGIGTCGDVGENGIPVIDRRRNVAVGLFGQIVGGRYAEGGDRGAGGESCGRGRGPLDHRSGFRHCHGHRQLRGRRSAARQREPGPPCPP